jgi:hypothetical protein
MSWASSDPPMMTTFANSSPADVRVRSPYGARTHDPPGGSASGPGPDGCGLRPSPRPAGRRTVCEPMRGPGLEGFVSGDRMGCARGDSVAFDLGTDPSGPGTCSWSLSEGAGNYIVPRGVRSPASGTGEKRLLVAPSKRPRAFSPAPTFGPRFSSGFDSNDSFSTHGGPTSFGAASLLVPVGAGRTTARDRDPAVARDDVHPRSRGRALVDDPAYRAGTPRAASPRPVRPRLRCAYGNDSMGFPGGSSDASLPVHAPAGVESSLGHGRVVHPFPFLSRHLSRGAVAGDPRRRVPSDGRTSGSQPRASRRPGRPHASGMRAMPHPAGSDRCD